MSGFHTPESDRKFVEWCILDEISDSDAETRIYALFQTPGPHYYSTICDSLRLPLDQVVRICDKLEAAGIIGAPPAQPQEKPCPADCVEGIAVDYGIGPDEACGECKGSGQAQPPCPMCNGTPKTQLLSGQVRECPECGGSGVALRAASPPLAPESEGQR